MRVILISLLVPTEHNYYGPSALPFSLSIGKPSSIDLDLYCYNRNGEDPDKVLNRLGGIFKNIYFIKKRNGFNRYLLKCVRWLFLGLPWKGVDFDYCPRNKDIEFISSNSYDLVWIYPNILFSWYKKLSIYNVVMTGPDCSILHYDLVEKYINWDSSLFQKDLRQIKELKRLRSKSFDLERLWARSEALIHVVGRQDKDAYDQMSAKSHCFFSVHPYSPYDDIGETMEIAKGKLTILIVGPLKSIYTGVFLTRILDGIRRSNSLKGLFRFLIVGEGWMKLSML